MCCDLHPGELILSQAALKLRVNIFLASEYCFALLRGVKNSDISLASPESYYTILVTEISMETFLNRSFGKIGAKLVKLDSHARGNETLRH